MQSAADQLPLQVNSDADAGEEIRLRYRFLDLRREKMQQNILLRSKVISSVRRRMIEQGFNEFQTPILTASSPEGARDFLVPSRMHPGKFYALPQAPQQFKQLLMMAGYDRYFQIAPCFRDEDSRADRSPGEFYQLDFEMSFVTQEDVFAAIEPVLYGIFDEFGGFRRPSKPDLTPYPFPRIPYAESMLKYGNDKPDLRNPLVITDVTSVFERDDVEFKAFKSVIAKGGVVRAIRAPNVGDRPRSFFDKLNDWAKGMGAPGLGYILFEAAGGKGPIAKFVPEAAQAALREAAGLERRRRRLLRLRPAGRRRQAGRLRPDQDRRRPRHRRKERLPLLLDRRFPDVRARRGNRQDRLQPQPVLDAPGRAWTRWKTRTR